jgi:hypothetical protein
VAVGHSNVAISLNTGDAISASDTVAIGTKSRALASSAIAIGTKAVAKFSQRWQSAPTRRRARPTLYRSVRPVISGALWNVATATFRNFPTINAAREMD